MEGHTTVEMLKKAEGLGWEVGYRGVGNYVTKANRLLAQDQARNPTRALDRHKAQRRMLYAKCVDMGDWRTAHAILKDLGELEGVYRKESPEDQAVHMEAFLAALGEQGAIVRSLLPQYAGGLTINGPVQINLDPGKPEALLPPPGEEPDASTS